MSIFKKKIFLSLITLTILFIYYSGNIVSGQNNQEIICTGCHNTITNVKVWTIDNRPYCENCFLKYSPKCHCCNAILLQGGYTSPYTNYTYCYNCMNNYPKCTNCTDPVGAKGVKLEATRWLCPECVKKGIYNYNQLKPLQDDAMKELRKLGIVITSNIETINLVDQKTLEMSYYNLQCNSYIPSGGLEGFNKILRQEGQPPKSNIYILYGFSYERTLAVLCHEIVHTWQAENCYPDQQLLLIEGFAEWIAYKVMISKGYKADAERLKKRNDPVYGKGLKFFLNVEHYYGVNGTLDYTKKMR